jgi:hypothetical protein
LNIILLLSQYSTIPPNSNVQRSINTTNSDNGGIAYRTSRWELRIPISTTIDGIRLNIKGFDNRTRWRRKLLEFDIRIGGDGNRLSGTGEIGVLARISNASSTRSHGNLIIG